MKQQIQLSDHFDYGRLIRFTLPSICMMIFTSIYCMVDEFFISNFVGKTAFASVNIIIPYLQILGGVGAMLGVGGSYLSFITGNVTNMKIPCAMNAQDIAGTESGTAESEIISTISVATSAIVTMLVIVVGVVLLVPLQPVLQNEMLLPAFNNVVPALFGALGLKYFAKSPKIAVIPLVLMSALCIFVPSMINQTSVLIIPSGALALAIGFILFKKDKL